MPATIRLPGGHQGGIVLYEAGLTFKDWIDRDNLCLQFSLARGLALASTIP